MAVTLFDIDNRRTQLAYNNAQILSSDYKERLLNAVKNYYFLSKMFFTFWLGIMTVGSIVGIFTFLFDDQMSEGLFAIPVFRIIATVACIGFEFLIWFGIYKLRQTTVKAEKLIIADNFEWRKGKVTDKERHRRKNSISYNVFVDDVHCILVEGNKYDIYRSTQIGDDFMMFKVDNMIFAMQV